MTLRRTPAELVAEAERRGHAGLIACAPQWGRISLGEVAEVVNGAAFSSAQFNLEGRGLPLIRIRDVGTSEVSTWYDGQWEAKHIVHAGDLLVGMDGDFRVAQWRLETGLLNQRVCRIDVDGELYDKDFLRHALQGYLDLIWDATSSTTVKHLSSRSVQQIPLPNPALSEQRRIVELIEEHLSHLDAADTALREARHRLLSLDRACLKDLPLGVPVPLLEVAEIQGGIQKSGRKVENSVPIPFLRVANVTSSGLDLREVHKYEVTGPELERLRLLRGDLLVVEGNGSPGQVGRAAVWDGSIPEAIHQNHIIRVRPDVTKLLPEYLEIMWNSPDNRKNLTAISSSTSGLHTLSVSKLRRVEIPLLDLETQREVSESVSSQRKIFSSVQEGIMKNQRRSQALRRAVLAAAFSGRLTGHASDADIIEEAAETLPAQETLL